MKKMILGLVAFSSVSVFANCDVNSIECHLGTYKGTTMEGNEDNHWNGSCEIEISRSGDKKNDIVYKNTYMKYHQNAFSNKGYMKENIISGKVSSGTQNYEIYDDVSRRNSNYETYISPEFVSHLELLTNIPQNSNKTLNALEIRFDDQEKVNAIRLETRIHQPISSALFSRVDATLGGHGIKKFRYNLDSCYNLVKIK